MKILLIAGHGAGDSGAVGCGYREADLTRELVNIIAGKLRNVASVDVYDQARNAYQDILNGRFSIGKYGYVLEIHFNAFNISAHGTECFVLPEEKGITVEQAIMGNMGKFFKLRDNDNIFDGVKKTRFAVINKAKKLGMSGALLETCFIDNQSDMQTYQQYKDSIADGIVAGIVEGFGINGASTDPVIPTPTPSASNLPTFPAGEYKLTGTMRVRTGAGLDFPQKSKSQLTVDGQRHANAAGCLNKGTNITILEVKTLTRSVWGKIPSGWICLYLDGEQYVYRR